MMHELWITLSQTEMAELVLGRLSLDKVPAVAALRTCRDPKLVSFVDLGGAYRLVFAYEDKKAGTRTEGSGV